jgi:hypothetical protein
VVDAALYRIRGVHESRIDPFMITEAPSAPRNRTAKKLAWLFAVATSVPIAAYGARPLVTDDTGTQGSGNRQLQAGVARVSDRAGDVYKRETVYNAEIAYGLREDIDLAAALPWISRRTDDATVSTVRGIGDAGADLKWRFFEYGDLSLALKPGLRGPTGDDGKALGTGRLGYRSFVITTFTTAPWAFHLQLGYVRNRNKLDERDSIHQASFAVVREFSGQLKLAIDAGKATNPDKSSRKEPRFLLVGAIYNVASGVDLDIGYKKGVSDPETDRDLIAGFTMRF